MSIPSFLIPLKLEMRAAGHSVSFHSLIYIVFFPCPIYVLKFMQTNRLNDERKQSAFITVRIHFRLLGASFGVYSLRQAYISDVFLLAFSFVRWTRKIFFVSG